MITTPINKKAYQLLHQGTLALSELENNGIKIDTKYCTEAERRLNLKIANLEKVTEKLPEVKKWKNIYRAKYNLQSNSQLGDILFNIYNYEPSKWTKPKKEGSKPQPSVDDEALKKLDITLTRNILKLRKWKKTSSTYLNAFTRETVDGILHPFFGLVIPRSYRGQSDHPNFQNIPIRDPEVGRIVRRAIIPYPGQILVERDYKGVEVSVSACYHQDQTFLHDITKGDMHRDAAMRCFKLPKSFLKLNWGEKSLKNIRYMGKNMWVFPQFYGDYYGNCAESMWDHVKDPNYSLPDGTLLKDHLKSVGIKNYDQFENHLKHTEDWFWNEKYKTYTAWKRKRLTEYYRDGYFDMLTGFRCSGVLLDKNQILNYPIQGSSFHCLLWSLIQLINDLFKKYKMKSRIIAQIHDCVLSSEHPSEVKQIDEISQEIMTKKLIQHWPWITAPMRVETESTDINESWYYKSEEKYKNYVN